MTEHTPEQEDGGILAPEQAVFGEDFSDQDIQRHVFVSDEDRLVKLQNLIEQTRYMYDKLSRAKTTLQAVNEQLCQVVSDTLEELGVRRGSPYPNLEALPWVYDKALHWKEVVDKRLGPSTDHLAAQFLLVQIQNSMATDCAMAASKASRPLSRAVDDLLMTRLFEHSHETEQILRGGPQLQFDKVIWLSAAEMSDRLNRALHTLNSRLHHYHLETPEARNALENAEYLASIWCPHRDSMDREAVKDFIASLEKHALDDSSEADAMSKERCERRWAILSAVMFFDNNNKILQGMRQASVVCAGVRRMLLHFFKIGDITTEIANQEDQEAEMKQQYDMSFARTVAADPSQQTGLHDDLDNEVLVEDEVPVGDDSPVGDKNSVDVDMLDVANDPTTPSRRDPLDQDAGTRAGAATRGDTSLSVIDWHAAMEDGSVMTFMATWLQAQEKSWPDGQDYIQLWEHILLISEGMLNFRARFKIKDQGLDIFIEDKAANIVLDGLCDAVNNLATRQELPKEFFEDVLPPVEGSEEQYQELDEEEAVNGLDDIHEWPRGLGITSDKLLKSAKGVMESGATVGANAGGRSGRSSFSSAASS